jgi:uncharacterized RDD family membrane protein YckC
MAEAESRCVRCGRTPGDVPPRPGAVHGALATQLRADTLPPDTIRAYARPRLEDGGSEQGDLFQDRPAGNVIPFPGNVPARSKAGTLESKAPAKPRAKRSGTPDDTQQALDFVQAPPSRPLLDTLVEARVCCDLPVAARVHRMIAAGVDLSLVVLGYAVFLSASRFVPAALDYQAAPFFGDRYAWLTLVGSFGLVAFAYGALCAIAGRDSIGMSWVGLELHVFDGGKPDRSQRMVRFFGACMASCSGIGLLWCLADEERLTWADHISGTFPTPRTLQSQVLLRR